MEIKSIHRPWMPKHRPHSSDPYYQSSAWKALRAEHRRGTTIVNGFPLRNIFCVDCYKESALCIPGANTDHVIARKDGGKDELSNLQTQCDTHHARKSAEEGNQRRKN
jgi:5-methylcytosine-specific restriction endonuclease McrA